MLLVFFLTNKYLMIVAWILFSIGYYFVLKKVGDNPAYAIIPFFAEWRICKYIYERNVIFLRPFLITLILILAGFYMNPLRGMGRLFIYVAFIIYFVFMMRMHSRLAKALNKPWWYYIIMFLFPPLFLYLIGQSKNHFVGPTFKIRQYYPRWLRYLNYAIITLTSLGEIVGIFLLVSFICIRNQQPRILANYLLKDAENKTKDVIADGTIVSNTDVIENLEDLQHSRDYFFKDHSSDKNVVVLEYIIGSNLENAGGLASANIKQMKDATTKGPNMKFVLEIGGSYRWFTDEIQENSNGRYVIEDGKLSLVEKVDSTISLSDPKQFEDFLKWAKKTYPADRYILVLWDHGAGFSLGYGDDSLNKRQGNRTMLVSEMAEAIKNADIKFDIIGFDACLMQNLETALAFEPYADYYIASEEVEGGYGWFYTSAFGKLAQNPGIPTLDFAKELISAYDVYNTALKDGKIDSSATLSVVDLTMIKPVYEELLKLFAISNDAILENSEHYADISLSASKAYTFNSKEQVDLINYLQILDSIDYDNNICKDNACLILADKIAAAIPYRNNNSAQGINGMALTFPQKALYVYDNIYKQFKEFGMEEQMNFYNNYFSIMAAQNEEYKYVTNEEWYIKGFEQYETSPSLIDIPLIETDHGYKIDLPEKIKKIIADTKVGVYIKENNKLKYIGKDYIGVNDVNGDAIIDMDNYWVHINNTLICYEAGKEREVEIGTIFTGTSRAILNGKDEIILNIEWEPISSSIKTYPAGKIVGYEFVNEEKAFMSKGQHQLQSGDRLRFVFDFYDEQGNLLEHKADGNVLYVTNPDRLIVRDKELEKGDLVFFGILTDIYERELETEQVNYHIN